MLVLYHRPCPILFGIFFKSITGPFTKERQCVNGWGNEPTNSMCEICKFAESTDNLKVLINLANLLQLSIYDFCWPKVRATSSKNFDKRKWTFVLELGWAIIPVKKKGEVSCLVSTITAFWKARNIGSRIPSQGCAASF